MKLVAGSVLFTAACQKVGVLLLSVNNFLDIRNMPHEPDLFDVEHGERLPQFLLNN